MDNITTLQILVVFSIFVILIFDWTNGFHDASNIIGPIIASRAMTPTQSVVVVAVFEMMGPLIAGTAVANTIGKFVDIKGLPELTSVTIVTCGIFGAIFWNLLTWWFGIPSSSSHAIVGGLAGAAMYGAGSSSVVWGWKEAITLTKLTGVMKVVASLIFSPIIGFWVGFFIYRFVAGLFRTATPALNKGLKNVQFLSAATLAFAHGSNDAQKSMGIITLVLILGGFQTGEAAKTFHVPTWVILACATAITIGILSGGWRIVRTVGFAIFKVRPIHAVCTQISSGGLILAASVWGFPVSTTHCVSSAIMGIGSSERPKAVRWAKAKEIVSTWIITIPMSGIVGALTYQITAWFVGVK